MSDLRITEIFYSLQGETNTVGIPTVFVRLTGCPLRCHYCDTAYAFSGGEKQSLEDIIQQIQSYQCQYVTVTGGEPLAQKNCFDLLTRLCDLNFMVSLETSGAMPVDEVDPRVQKVLDVKTPSSGECDRNLLANFDFIEQKDEVKFVIGNRDDYEWAKQMISEHRLTEFAQVLFSPEHQNMLAATLADWILADKLKVRFQIQLHKVLWGNEQGR